ncbi:hypothetical protein SHYC_07475 [Staphylococcus hyicus]|nr:hypothetical protein SHYC_07475 [Staphylococcus hyicus]
MTRATMSQFHIMDRTNVNKHGTCSPSLGWAFSLKISRWYGDGFNKNKKTVKQSSLFCISQYCIYLL